MAVRPGVLKFVPAFLAAIWLGSVAGAAFAEGDATAGERVFGRCNSCHTLAAPSKGHGPHLRGIVGRKVATAEDFVYSKGMKAFGATGAVWGEATLDGFLSNPMVFVEGTRMLYPTVRNARERSDLIAFLKTIR